MITGRAAAQELVRPFVVVLAVERIKGALLGGEGAVGRSDGAGLQRLVHTLMRRVVLRGGGPGALVLDAELHPPDVELREAVDAGGREGHAVVGANRAGQPVAAKGALEAGAASTAIRSTSRVRKCPLKSAVHRSLGACVTGATTPGW